MRSKGLTIIELLVVVIITAVLASIAMPSFTDLIRKKRVEGIAGELSTDIQLGRTEAVQRNQSVQLTLGSGCYVVHALGSIVSSPVSTTSCSQGANSVIGSGQTEIKTVQIPTDAATILSPSAGSILFDPIRGTATITSASTMTISSSVSSWRLQVVLAAIGRSYVCSPSGAGYISGYPEC